MVEGADTLVLAQNPGEFEERGSRVTGYGRTRLPRVEPCDPQPLVGPTGYMMDRKWLPLAGLQRSEVSVANTLRCRWQGRNDVPAGSETVARGCMERHFKPPASTRLVVAQGAWGLYGATGYTSIEPWRGWAVPPLEGLFARPVTVLPMYHVAYLFKAPWEEPTAESDWRKVKRVREGTWPRPMPRVEDGLPPTLPDTLAFDTEYLRGNQLTRYSVAWEDRVAVIEANSHVPFGVPAGATIYGHNWAGSQDYRLWHDLGGRRDVTLDDTMMMHAVLYSDLAHDLGYVGSLYARINRWKHLRDIDERAYSAGDAVATLDAGLALRRVLDADAQSRRVYEAMMRPLIGILARYAAGPGHRVDRERVAVALRGLDRQKRAASGRSQAAAGWPLALSSPKQVATQLFGVEGL